MFHAFAHDQPVDDNLDVMLVFLVELRRFLDIVKLAIDPDAGKARLLPLEQFLAIFALAATHDRREQEEAGFLGQGHHPVDHL